MLTVHPRYITDDQGKKLSVVLPMDEFEALMEELDDLDDLRLYNEAKLDMEPSVPIDEAFAIIERNRDGK